MTVYIEYVLIDNFVIDFLLIKATFTLLKKEYKKGRLFFCAFLGAIIALFYPLIQIEPILLTFLKIASGLLIVALAKNYNSKKEFAVFSITFFLLTFALGGTLIGIFGIFGIKEYGEVLIALIVLPAYLLIKLFVYAVKLLLRKKQVYPFLFKCQIVYRDNRVEFTGFLDTGNGLYFGETPVTVIGRKAFLRLVKTSFPKIEYLEYQTVMGKSKMPTFIVDELKIYYCDKENIIYNARVGLSGGGQAFDYDLILHPALVGENDDKFIKTKTEKVS